MKQRYGFFTLISLLVIMLYAATADSRGKPQSNEPSRYLIQYSAGSYQELQKFIHQKGGRIAFDYSALINGMAVDLSGSALKELRRSGLATSIEADSERTQHVLPGNFPLLPFEEFVPWGVDRVEADQLWSSEANSGPADNGIAMPEVLPGSITGGGIVVAVLDSGIDYGHPDLMDNILDLRGDGVIRDFLDGDEDPTDATGNGHGSNVASVIASVDNDVGVIGVAPEAKISPYRVCDGTCPLSAIIGGLVQAVLDGVDVINMSFGGPAGFNIEASAIQAANKAGVILVASAGNESTQQPSFPAAYDTVVAVGATDIGDSPAGFTNVGGWVDITGPGVQIPVATCRGCGRFAMMMELSPMARMLSPVAMEGTGVSSAAGTEIVDLGRGCVASQGDVYNSDPAGKVALIQRGACSFAEKVMHAEAAGAVAVAVFNNVPGNFNGTLGDFTAAVPAVSLSLEEGLLLQADIASEVTLVDISVVASDYDTVDGTSFSGPHVAGVAALILQVAPESSPIQVRKLLEKNAERLGPKVIFGNGMVRADNSVGAAQ